MVICDICEKSFTIKKSKKQHYKVRCLCLVDYYVCDDCRKVLYPKCNNCTVELDFNKCIEFNNLLFDKSKKFF